LLTSDNRVQGEPLTSAWLVKSFTSKPVRTSAAAAGRCTRRRIPILESRSWTSMDWRHRALCRDEDPELFFPIGNTGPALLQIEQAKAVCRRCPVIQDCLAWALETGQDAGVWGGMSEDERRALKRRGARPRARTA
jgi:WhiB family redox-sensing transcriptional regulator